MITFPYETLTDVLFSCPLCENKANMFWIRALATVCTEVHQATAHGATVSIAHPRSPLLLIKAKPSRQNSS